MRDVFVAITAASYSGNKGAAAMLQSSIRQLRERYGSRLNINLMSVYPKADPPQIPWDSVKVVPAKPEQVIFIGFPLAILYRLFRWCPPAKALLLKNKILRAYSRTDVVLDEAGISFVDSRGFIMNTYAFMTMAIPMLMGVPVVKYSQAMGTFRKLTNRLEARIILPRLKLICARGELTRRNLEGIGVTKNVKLCADGAFTMADDPEWTRRVEEVCGADDFYRSDRIVGVSPSTVVDKKCRKSGIDYAGILVSFIETLVAEGYPVLLFANSAREGSAKPRNNDLILCQDIYDRLPEETRAHIRWYPREMAAEEVRSYIGKCRYVVTSRFHAMIGSLQKRVPVLLIGWSHKYQEVLDQFGLGRYAADFSALSLETLMADFHRFAEAEGEIRSAIDAHYDEVMASSRRNIEYIAQVIDETLDKPYKKALLDYKDPDRYMGPHILSRRGYATDETIRENAASGGSITALLCYLLRSGRIDGALVSRTDIRDGQVGTKTFIATTEAEIRDASSSVYMAIPMMQYVEEIKKFPGKVAVVMVPCMMKALSLRVEKDAELRDKVALKVGLYCSGNHSSEATKMALKKAGISLEDAQRFYYRRGHWRGNSAVLYKDGTEKAFSYTKYLCSYKNAYFFEQSGCMTCQDHYANAADIAFGDVWLGEMKKEPIKNSSVVIRSEKALEWYKAAVAEGVLADYHVSDRDMDRSQKRALVYKFRCASAKEAFYARQGRKVALDTQDKSRWNHKLAFALSERDRRYSLEKPDRLAKAPINAVYLYMCFIRFLLSF